MQKKAVSKFADLIRVDKNKWTPILTERSVHAAWLVYARQNAIRGNWKATSNITKFYSLYSQGRI